MTPQVNTLSQTQSKLEQANAHIVDLQNQLGNTNRADTDYKRAYENEYAAHQDTHKALEQVQRERHESLATHQADFREWKKERDELQAKCAKLEACCAEMRLCLDWFDPFSELSERGRQGTGRVMSIESCPACGNKGGHAQMCWLKKARLATCGQAFLERLYRSYEADTLKEIRDALSNPKPEQGKGKTYFCPECGALLTQGLRCTRCSFKGAWTP